MRPWRSARRRSPCPRRGTSPSSRSRIAEDRRGQGEDHKGRGHDGRGDDDKTASVVETERRDAAQLDDHRGKENATEERSNSGKGKGESRDGEDSKPAATPADPQQKGDGGEGKDGEKSGSGDSSGSSGHDSGGDGKESDHSGKDGGKGGDGAVPELTQTVTDVVSARVP